MTGELGIRQGHLGHLVPYPGATPNPDLFSRGKQSVCLQSVCRLFRVCMIHNLSLKQFLGF